MTTASWATPVDHTSTAGFRTWGSELNAKFAAVGMVQTTDTGQINWSTTTVPAANTIAGYEIWKLSSSNLYFKIQYGTGNATTAPEIQLQVGTGSNGTGTLTGPVSTNTSSRTTSAASPSSSTANFQSYLCATANYFFLSWKIAAQTLNQALNFMMACQTVDSTGAATSLGYFVMAGGAGSGASAQSAAISAAVLTTLSNSPLVFTALFGETASTPTTSQDGSGNNQAFLWWYSVPGAAPVLPILHGATLIATDLSLGSSATLTLVGATGHTYISSTHFWGSLGNISGTSIGLAMLYE